MLNRLHIMCSNFFLEIKEMIPTLRRNVNTVIQVKYTIRPFQLKQSQTKKVHLDQKFVF